MARKEHLEKIKSYELTPAAKGGVLVLPVFSENIKKDAEIFQPHREKYYTLIIGTSGSIRMMLDFKESHHLAPVMILICPGQVHRLTELNAPSGWTVNFESSLVDEELQQNLESVFYKAISLAGAQAIQQQLIEAVKIIHDLQMGTPSPAATKAKNHLLSGLLNLIIARYYQHPFDHKLKENRAKVIYETFSQLLKKNFISWKKPAVYAEALSITVAHLNEIVKSHSGLPVSVVIQQQGILEAKRLLYFTKKSVKEIGYESGYDNPIYFSKLFKQSTGVTPLEFRAKFHD